MLLVTLGASLLTPFHPGFLIPVFYRGRSKLQPPAINPVWLMLWSSSACRPSKIGSPGIQFFAIAPLIFADMAKINKNQGIAKRFISPKQKQFFMFCKKDMIANKIFFQKIYRLHVFRLGCVVQPRPKLDKKCKNLILSVFSYSSIDPVWLML